MSRYIDADRLKDTIQNNDYVLSDWINSTGMGMFTTGIFEAIDEQPTADVVEVVMCKGCEHFEAINNDDHGWCKMISDLPCGISVRYDDDYCSFGERADK